MGPHIASGKCFLKVTKELRVDGHDIFVVTMNRAILNHLDLPILLDDLRLDLSHFLMEKIFVIFLPIEDRLTGLTYTLRAQGIRLTRPTQRRLDLLVRFQ